MKSIASFTFALLAGTPCLRFLYDIVSPSIAMNFFIISVFGISLLNIATLYPLITRFLAMFAATVVFPFAGLPAIIVISPLVIPDITLSNLLIPVLIFVLLSKIDFLVSSRTSSMLNSLEG